jgi:hypothetical protein
MTQVLQTNIFKTVKEIPLPQIIDRYCPEIKLRGGKMRLKGSCPLHIDRDPSFVVYPSSNSWYCFSCCNGGDGVRLVQLLTGLSPLDAARLIAGNFGVSVDDISPQKARKRARDAAMEREIEEQFNQRVTQAYDVLCFFIRTVERRLLLEGYEAYLKYSALVHRLPVWNYLADLLLNGDLETKIKALKHQEVKAWLE